MKEKPICRKCKSEHIVFTEAHVVWSEKRQEFEVDNAGNEYYCKKCIGTFNEPDWIEYEESEQKGA